MSGTFRSAEGKAHLRRRAPGGAFGVLLDVTDHECVRSASPKRSMAGAIDVLVNNAGYGLEAPSKR